MDNITLLGVIGSIVSIISLFISLLGTNTRNETTSHNKNSFNTTINSNNNYNFSTNITNNHSSSPSGSSSNSQDPMANVFLAIIALALVVPFYLNHQNEVILYITLFGLIGVIVNLLVLLWLSKKVPLDRYYLASHTLKWFPIFIMLIFIYKPLYTSSTIEQTKSLLKLGKELVSIAFSHSYDVFYFAVQTLGLGAILFFIAINIFYSIKQLYNTYKNNVIPSKPTWKSYIFYILTIVFLFTLVSGLYTKLFILLNTVTKIQ